MDKPQPEQDKLPNGFSTDPDAREILRVYMKTNGDLSIETPPNLLESHDWGRILAAMAFLVMNGDLLPNETL